jgi:hypothetical protein
MGATAGRAGRALGGVRDSVVEASHQKGAGAHREAGQNPEAVPNDPKSKIHPLPCPYRGPTLRAIVSAYVGKIERAGRGEGRFEVAFARDLLFGLEIQIAHEIERRGCSAVIEGQAAAAASARRISYAYQAGAHQRLLREFLSASRDLRSGAAATAAVTAKNTSGYERPGSPWSPYRTRTGGSR